MPRNVLSLSGIAVRSLPTPQTTTISYGSRWSRVISLLRKRKTTTFPTRSRRSVTTTIHASLLGVAAKKNKGDPSQIISASVLRATVNDSCRQFSPDENVTRSVGTSARDTRKSGYKIRSCVRCGSAYSPRSDRNGSRFARENRLPLSSNAAYSNISSRNNN